MRVVARVAGALGCAALVFGGRVGAGEGGVRIDGPLDDAIVGRHIRVTGQVPLFPVNAVGVLWINGANVAVEENRFDTTIDAIAEGLFKLRAVFSEIGSFVTVDERSVVVDWTLFVIETK